MQSLKINKDTLKHMKGLSKVIYIIARISWIVLLLLTFLVALVGVIFIVVLGNMELYNTDGTLNEYGQVFDTTITNNFMNTYNGDLEQVEEAKEIAYDLADGAYKEDFIIFLAVVFFGLVIQMSLVIFLLMKLDNLFLNIAKESTPFSKENPKIIRMIGWGFGAYLILECFCSYVSSQILPLNGGFKMNFNLSLIVLILIIFAISYVFNYAYELQKNYVRVAKELEEGQE